METLVANLGSARRVVDSHGTWLVAPMTLIVPGVLDGSRGPLYYPPNEIAQNHKKWHGYPITRNHPVNASAYKDGIYDSVGMGVVRNPAIVDNKLVAEGWFHEERTRKVDPQVWNSLIEGRQLELSTGLGVENVVENGECPVTKRRYTAIARNYQPDHVAVLTDGQVGACSIHDGCGVNNAGKSGNPQSTVTGRFKPTGSGTGSGEVHEAAQAGHLSFNDLERDLGRLARDEKTVLGNNPASWVEDEGTWERAKEAAGKRYVEEDEEYWAATTAIYKRMGGAVKTHNANPEGCNQYKDCGGSDAIRDVTPDGYGPTDATEEGASYYPSDYHQTTSEQQLRSSINEAQTILKGKMSKEKRGAIQRSLDSTKSKLEKLMSGQPQRPLSPSETDKPPINFHATNEVNANECDDDCECEECKKHTTEDTAMNRDQAITHLTTNCVSWKGKKELLSNKQSFTDEEVIRLAQEHQANTLAVNTLQQIGKQVGAPETLTINAMPAFIKDKMAVDPEEEEEETDEYDNPIGKKKAVPVGNAKRTTEQWIADAPPEAREMLNGLIANERSAKTELIGKLVANAKPEVKARLQKSLSTKLVHELRDLVELLPVANTRREDPLVNYFGAAGGSNDVTVENTSLPDGVDYDGQWPVTMPMQKRA